MSFGLVYSLRLALYDKPVLYVKGGLASAAIPQPRGCDERCPSVLLDLGVGEKAEEIRMTF